MRWRMWRVYWGRSLSTDWIPIYANTNPNERHPEDLDEMIEDDDDDDNTPSQPPPVPRIPDNLVNGQR